jgi:hypothetical protein
MTLNLRHLRELATGQPRAGWHRWKGTECACGARWPANGRKCPLPEAQSRPRKSVPVAPGDLLQLLDRLERAEGALKFYAADQSWDRLYKERPNMPALVDRGERARAYFASVEKGGGG